MARTDQMATKSLYELLNESLERSLGDNEKFLPLSVLSEEITKQRIKETLPVMMRVFPRGLISKIIGKARKLFAILVLIGEPHFIRELLSEKISDRDLPFSRAHRGDDIIRSSQGQDLQGFVSWKNPAKVDSFLEKQWCVLAPVLDFSGGHISMNEQRIPLPVLGTKEVEKSLFSTVYKSTIHSAHRPEPPYQNLEIAIKKFVKDTDFFKELKILEDIHDLHNSHLIQHLTTWEYREAYYIIFPWAHGGNLKNLWKRNKLAEVGSKPILWALTQMLGLSSALRDLHNKKNCRHGDLKPENILYFNTNGQNTLVVADVGVSRIHNVATQFRQDGTSTKATTLSYEPPEVILREDTPRSRKYDIWSLGCIFLEFVNWLLDGYEAVEKLHDSGRPDFVFYELIDERKTARVHPEVIANIAKLQKDERCKGTGMEHLVNLISERLLMVEVDQRDSADQLCDKLKRMVKEANHGKL